MIVLVSGWVIVPRERENPLGVIVGVVLAPLIVIAPGALESTKPIGKTSVRLMFVAVHGEVVDTVILNSTSSLAENEIGDEV